MELHLHLSVAFRALDRKWGEPVDLDSSEDLTTSLPAVVDLPTTTFSSEEFLKSRRTQNHCLKAEQRRENVNDTFADISCARIPSVSDESGVEESSNCTEESSSCPDASSSCTEESSSCTEESSSCPEETSCPAESSGYSEESTGYRDGFRSCPDDSEGFRNCPKESSSCSEECSNSSVKEFNTDIVRSVERHFEECEADFTAIFESGLESNKWRNVFRLLKDRTKFFIEKCKKISEQGSRG